MEIDCGSDRGRPAFGSGTMGPVSGSADSPRERNAAGLRRLAALAGRVGLGGAPERLRGGWTAPAVLAHLAFWDRFVIARWDRYESVGTLEPLPGFYQDLVNDSALPLWLALGPATAAGQAVEAATACCERIASLPPAAVETALSSGREWMLDRSHHWAPHLDELEAALGGG